MSAIMLSDITIRPIRSDNVWRWLSDGWVDMWRRPGISMGYGLAVALIGYALVACLYFFHAVWLLLPLAAAFMFGGPLIAVGLYEMSRRYRSGDTFGIGSVVGAFRRAPLQLAYMGLILMLFALAWIRIATILFALFFGTEMPPLGDIFASLFLTQRGVLFLSVGTAIGAVLAFGAFALSVVSVPMIVDREVDAMTATIASLSAIRRNFMPLLLWSWLIALMTAVGIVLLFFGLIVIFPLIGHATWHCYRDVVSVTGQAPAAGEAGGVVSA